MKESLLDLAIAGDEGALGLLLERHGPSVAMRLRIPRALRSLLSVDDVMQQTYCDVFADLGGFEPRGEGSFRGWLTVLARHNLTSAVRMLRAERRGGAWLRVQIPSRTRLSAFGPASGSAGTPSRACRQDARVELGRSPGARLPGPQRLVVQLSCLEELPMEEVALRLRRSVGAAYMLRSRALRLLARSGGGLDPCSSRAG